MSERLVKARRHMIYGVTGQCPHRNQPWAIHHCAECLTEAANELESAVRAEALEEARREAHEALDSIEFSGLSGFSGMNRAHAAIDAVLDALAEEARNAQLAGKMPMKIGESIVQQKLWDAHKACPCRVANLSAYQQDLIGCRGPCDCYAWAKEKEHAPAYPCCRWPGHDAIDALARAIGWKP